jgi:DNA-binding NtrC family response regulator
LKILVAEDDEDIMNTYQLALNSRNHEIVSALDGEDCMRIFNDHFNELRKQNSAKTGSHYTTSMTAPFDLVILDYRMPKKNGLEVAERILSIAPEQRIIIASAYTHELKTPSNIQQSLELLQKPFGLDVLFSTVERVPEGVTRRYGQRPSPNNNYFATSEPSTIAAFDEHLNKMSDCFDLSTIIWPEL